MKYAHLVWAALRRRPTRTLLTALSIFTAFFLFGVLQGVNAGIGVLVELTRPNHLLVWSRVSMQTPLPVAHVAQVAAVPGVKAVAGTAMLFGSYQEKRGILPLVGTDIEALFRVYSEQMSAPPEQLAAAARLRTGAIVGRVLARANGWKVGDRVPIRVLNARKADGSNDWAFDIVGLYDREQDNSTWIIANYDYINEARVSGKDTVSGISLSVADPAEAAHVAQAIDDLFANSANQTMTQTERDFLENILRQIGDIGFLVNGIVGAVLFTLLFLTANTMAQSVRERIPELAVLKTLGFTDTAVQWLVLSEALLLCVIAAVAGLALAVAVLPAFTYRPGLGMGAMHVPGSVFGAGALIAVLMALAAGIPLARKARRLEIAAVLAGR